MKLITSYIAVLAAAIALDIYIIPEYNYFHIGSILYHTVGLFFLAVIISGDEVSETESALINQSLRNNLRR